MPRVSARTLVTLGTGLAAVLLVLGALAVREARVGDRFDLVRWQIDTVPPKAIAAVRSTLGGGVDAARADEVLRDYFALDPSSEEARALENAVEAAIEGRIDAVIRELGLTARLPLPGTAMPPVMIELATPPRVLVVSPRAEIRRERVELLHADLSLAESEAIEARTEANAPDHASIVVGSGGVATYPAIVSHHGSYAGVVQTAAHEWTHHYLAFYPLGLGYFVSDDLRTVNETVADIVGEEIAAIVLARWDDPTRPAPAEASTPPPAPAVDVNEVLRELRIEVDALLEAGAIEAAEARMEAVRLELWEAGHRIRRLNQAYFAWYGTYAARPDAVDPIGEQLREVRARVQSLDAFLAQVRGIRSRADVEALVERLRAADAGGG